MKILLINLPKDKEVRDTTTPDYLLYDFMSYPPLGLLAIAPAVDSRHSLSVLDTSTRNMSIEQVVDYIKDYQPDVLGISVVTRRLFAMLAISRMVKDLLPSIKVVIGGPHVNSFPEETIRFESVDYILIGYGEIKFSQLIEAIDKEDKSLLESIPGLYYKEAGQIKINSSEDERINIDEFLFPDRRLVNLEDYFTAADRLRMTTMYTSRGCPYRCIFCDVQDKTFRYRSPGKIVDEIESIAALGIQEIHFFDDTFNVMRQRVIEICKEIIKRKLNIKWSARARLYPCDRQMLSLMKDAGCNRLHVGVESLDSHILEIIKKEISLEQIYNFFSLCNEFKIDTLAYFIIGFTEETQEYRNALYEKILKLNPTYVYVNVLYPAAKSEFYYGLLRKGVLKKDYWTEFAADPVPNFELPLCRPSSLQDELRELSDNIHKKFYLSPKFIINELKRNPSPRMLIRKARIAAKLFIETTLKKF